MSKTMNVSCPGFIFSLVLVLASALLGFFSSSAFMLWLVMELGVCSFCGVLAFFEPSNSESVGKYFVANSLSGVGLLCGLVLYLGTSISSVCDEVLSWVFLICLLTKLGLPPFHFWVLGALHDSAWVMVFLLLTVQKILPLIFFGSSVDLSNEMVLLVIFSAGLAGIGGLGYNKPFLILGFSSMVVTSWLVLVSSVDSSILLYSLGLYTITFLVLLSCMRELGSKGCFGGYTPWILLGLILSMGVPNSPTLLMKLWIYQSLLNCGCVLGAWGVVLTSVMLLPLYMRIIIMAALKVWGDGVNESIWSGWVVLPVMLSLMFFFLGGIGWILS